MSADTAPVPVGKKNGTRKMGISLNDCNVLHLCCHRL